MINEERLERGVCGNYQRIRIITIVVTSIILWLAGCSSQTPPDRFLSLPVHYLSSDNIESEALGITVGEFFMYGAPSEDAERSWKKNGNDSWTMLINNRKKGEKVNIDMEQKSSPDRVVLKEMLYNGGALSGAVRVIAINQMVKEALAAKK
jgi:hypothetical protein